MYIVSDEIQKSEEIEIHEDVKEIIFSSPYKKEIIAWLLEHGFHESFIEDIQNEEQSIVYEESESFKLLVFKYFKRSSEHPLYFIDTNIIMIITEKKLFFLCEEKDVIQRIVARFRRRYKKGDSIPYVTYTLIDILIDATMGMVDLVDDKLEIIEDTIFAEEFDEEETQKSLYFARRSLNRISKVSVQENDVINKLYNHYPSTVRKKLKFEFIDLKEHLSFLINESKAYLERTGYLQNLIMGYMSNRMNQTMQRLTGITLIFLPLSFIVGNYGMNFKYMPELEWKYGYFAVWILNIIIALGLYLWLRKKRWI
ncbi:magnesium transporter [Nitratiruptor sp. YY08-26]|uniref:magnesium transporter CorA family protein n=1 Tax=unclassified Nitratiruptor TaxID=2624044 RepID=UPI0019165B37|nr:MULTISPECIES: magnesium transporter CorA family protein [unclassified Nitratiruptor]BCD62980.1 magnesium transporter [Nitratiruptor sp. YY08-13]BCD66915.1 magnesium transporter [Nitratiruptor sp. YY08-26]